jgi:Ala-tRNA(Pro) deacylase
MTSIGLTSYLEERQVPYEVIPHLPAFTAQCIAGLTHTPGRELAKAVMVELDGELVMAVLPAVYRVDLRLLKRATGAQTAALACEEDFYGRFPDCETGAMPPFGNLYGFKVFADESLTVDAHIAFNAGSHRELIRIAWDDFVRLANPRIIRLAAHHMSSEAA